MSNYESHLRIFKEIRMHPWIPEHKVFIDSEIAKLAVTDKKESEWLREVYDKKMAKYQEELKQEETKAEEALKDGDISMEDLRQIIANKEKKAEESVEVEETSKKRGRKPKSSPSLS